MRTFTSKGRSCIIGARRRDPLPKPFEVGADLDEMPPNGLVVLPCCGHAERISLAADAEPQQLLASGYARSMNDRAGRHRRAAVTHREAARRHMEAAERWDQLGELERADLERRNAKIEFDAAELESDRAALVDREQTTAPSRDRPETIGIDERERP